MCTLGLTKGTAVLGVAKETCNITPYKRSEFCLVLGALHKSPLLAGEPEMGQMSERSAFGSQCVAVCLCEFYLEFSMCSKKLVAQVAAQR